MSRLYVPVQTLLPLGIITAMFVVAGTGLKKLTYATQNGKVSDNIYVERRKAVSQSFWMALLLLSRHPLIG